MDRSEDIRPYLIEVSPRMWSRIGALDRDGFNRLRERAAAVAGLLAETRFLDGEAKWPAQGVFCLGEDWVLYRVEPGSERFVVEDVLPELPLRRDH